MCALGRWLEYEKGALLTSLLTLDVVRPRRWKRTEEIDDDIRCDLIETACCAAPSLQRLTCGQSDWKDPVPMLVERRLHPMRSHFTSLHCEPDTLSLQEMCRWIHLRELVLNCRWFRWSTPTPLSLSLPRPTISFPVLETLNLSHINDMLPFYLVQCAPCLRTLSVTCVGTNVLDDPWRPPSTLTRLHYQPTLCIIHHTDSTPARVNLVGMSGLRYLYIDSHLMMAPATGLLLLPALTELCLIVSEPCHFTLEMPALLSLRLDAPYLSPCTFDFRRLVIGDTLHSCRLNIKSRESTIRALTQLARVPRPGCLIYLGRRFGDLGPLRNRRIKVRDRGVGGGEERARRRTQQRTDEDVVWVQRPIHLWGVVWRNYVARQDQLRAPLRFHSLHRAALETRGREQRPTGTRLLSVIAQLARQGAILLDEDFARQYACPTDHPTCLCRQLLPP